jgi:hypothetical protein
MGNDVIDSKTDVRDFGSLIHVNISTTLTLAQTGPGQRGILYEIAYSGIKSGNVTGGPLPVQGEGCFQPHEDPPVTVTVSEYADVGSSITMRIHIQVQIPILGSKTIFDQILSGSCGGSQLRAV